eukprot:GDKI01000098.1.p1 GENE.GDKI01000098.1~~GDKI01000098.1.p1  ORF type:complete len:520 (+),score=164.34 GDKI01000098.1:124-1560(+)
MLLQSLPLSSLTAVSPIDGRYGSKTESLREYFSEYGLIKSRIKVEVEWLRHMAACEGMAEIHKLSPEADAALGKIAEVTLQDAENVKKIEATTNHDVKAVEYHIKQKIAASGIPELQKLAEFTHFACTSEDINNLSYALMLKGAVTKVIIPSMHKVIDTLALLAISNADVPMLSRTHGQPATPTTFGKEVANVAYRLQGQLTRGTSAVKFFGKFNGAVGNFNAHVVAYPHIDWPTLAREFVEDRLGLTYQPYSTQIECHDFIAELSDSVSRFNTILLDFDQDIWTYISRDMLKLKPVKDEVGSSTMPHKVNPIDFENSEGNLGLANAVFKFFSSKLPVSRMQRDLTDSTVLRNLGVAFGHSILAYESTLKGLSKIAVDDAAMKAELERNWMVLAEPIQTVLRMVGAENPYETLKELTRGQTVDREKMQTFVKSLAPQLSEAQLQALLALTPQNYIGIAPRLATEVFQVIADMRAGKAQ